jgi:crotonobetainyl-CoA:carnitine CoA-transferase CaiB-like acyl-CoA transferase
MTTACEGLRVLEVSVGMAGNLAGLVLADNGAEVVKVEPPSGDPMRESPAFVFWGRGKKSVVLDLKTDAGRADFDRLVAGADALIEDLAPGEPEKLGIGYDRLSAINPGLVYGAVTGWGEKGPYKDIPGYDAIVSAKSGRMTWQEGFRPGPIFSAVPVATYGAAMLVTQGVLAALYARRQTGRGQRVHTSLLHALTAYDMLGLGHHLQKNEDPGGRGYGVIPLAFMTPRCADGRYLQMCSRQPHLFWNWMRVLGLEHLREDRALKDLPDLAETREDLHSVLEMVANKMAEKTTEEWLEIFRRTDVGADPFLTPTEFMSFPQMVENGRIVTIDDPTVGRTTQVGPLALMSETPSVIGAPAPRLGQHTAEVLGAAGETNGRRQTAITSQASSDPQAATPRRPLDGVTVLEIAYFYAAPYSMTLLCELGARVIKVEPPSGDPNRRNWASVYTKTTPGKESVVLDLKTPEGLEAFYKIVPKADIFLHNFRPGVPERLKVDYETLRKINPRLIYMYGSLYGSKGPEKHRPGFHSTPNALAGGGIIESGKGNPPADRTFPDPTGALGVATAAMLGLQARERTGKGQYIETTMLTSLGYAMGRWDLLYAGKEDPIPDQGQHGYHALHRLYRTGETWLFLMTPREEQFAALARALGVPDLVKDPRFATRAARKQNDAALAACIEERLQAHPADRWEDILLAAGVPAVRADVPTNPEFMRLDPHVLENKLAIEVEVPGYPAFWRNGMAYEFSEMSTRVGGLSPLGGSTAAILREVGYTDAQIEDFDRRGITHPVGHGLRI